MSLRGELLEQESLARFTSWRVGGQAERVYLPADLEDLQTFLGSCPAGEPITWLGLGSNTLVRDGGIEGTVIITQGRLKKLCAEHDQVIVEAGVSCAQFARFAARMGGEDLAFLATVPGTMGGALAMNAGAYGHETWDTVASVQTVDRQGTLHTRTPQDFAVSYRHVALHDTVSTDEEWFVSATFNVPQGDAAKASARIKELLAHRATTQPTGEHTCGSVFRNPQGDYAGRLIEQAGLKNYAVGAARVSEKHANFMVNAGNATAAEMEQLISEIAQRIEQEHGIALIPEVHIKGKKQ